VHDDVIVAEASRRADRSHAVSLPALVLQVLDEAGIESASVGGLAVSIGPGSFTGLRVGLAFAKGLAWAGRVPLAPVPTLEALAWVAEAAPGSRVCAAIDARKGEIYAALFTIGPTGAPVRETPDRAWNAHDLAARLPDGTIVVGDADVEYGDVLGVRAHLRPGATHPPRGGVVARLGAARLRLGGHQPLDALEPVYVRPADATLPERPLR